MLSITQAQYVGDFKIELTFNDGLKGVADLREYLMNEPRSVFWPLRDKAVFCAFELKHDTITWLNGDVDLAPEYLYFLAFRHDPALQEQYREWGYLAQEIIAQPVAVEEEVFAEVS